MMKSVDIFLCTIGLALVLSVTIVVAVPADAQEAQARAWTIDQVVEWLNDNKFDEYEHAFRTERIDGEVLMDLTVNDLKDLGMDRLGDRKRFIRVRNEKLRPVADDVLKELMDEMHSKAPSKAERDAAPKREIPKQPKKPTSPTPPKSTPPKQQRQQQAPKKQTKQPSPSTRPPTGKNVKAPPPTKAEPVKQVPISKCLPSDKELMRRSVEQMSRCVAPYQGLSTDQYKPDVVLKLCKCLADFRGRVTGACMEEIPQIKDMVQEYEKSVGPMCKQTERLEETDTCKAEEMTVFAHAALNMQECVKGQPRQACSCVQKLVDAPEGCRSHPAMKQMWKEVRQRMSSLCPEIDFGEGPVRDLNNASAIPCMSLTMRVMNLECLKDHFTEKIENYTQEVLASLCNDECGQEAKEFNALHETCDPTDETEETLQVLRTVSVNLKALCVQHKGRFVFEDFQSFSRLLKKEGEAGTTASMGKKLSAMLADRRKQLKISPVEKISKEQAEMDAASVDSEKTAYSLEEKKAVCSEGSREVFRVFVEGHVINKKILLGLNVLCSEGEEVSVDALTEGGALLQNDEFGDMFESIKMASNAGGTSGSKLDVAMDAAIDKKQKLTAGQKKKNATTTLPPKKKPVAPTPEEVNEKKMAEAQATANKAAVAAEEKAKTERQAQLEAQKKEAQRKLDERKRQADEQERGNEAKRVADEEAAAKRKVAEQKAADAAKAANAKKDAEAKKKAAEAEQKAKEAKKKAEQQSAAKKKKEAEEAQRKKNDQNKKPPPKKQPPPNSNKKAPPPKQGKKPQQHGDKNTPIEDLEWTNEL
jgi:hypothetical protein